ncbi:hypothetical protein QR680_010047 [Steinernema hermaphroditum]|uniref:Uncharacterized protein n=1 Tax=Steinernema hermaphroditum TaxID=289476 RepID=A0AA39MAH9_9BILA|nr:hypothetical protein QR680_010047 [Steinernema hermaphroditum]
MDLQTLQGITLLLLAVVGLPVYIRILYIFISRPVYRCLECYQIMIQIGIVQCLIAPGAFMQGLMQLLNYDPFGLASITIKSYPAVVRTEALMSCVLALNRLKIICKLQYPQILHKVCLVVIWIFGVCFCTSLFVLSPSLVFTTAPGVLVPFYDQSRPLSLTFRQITSTFLVATCCLNLLFYMIIIAYLAYLKQRTGFAIKSRRERSIFLYASIRFAFDITISLLLTYRPFGDNSIGQFLLSLGYPFYHMALTQILYIAMYKDIRRQFVPFQKKVTMVTTIGVVRKDNLSSFSRAV